jgi:hypothetical protein
LAKEQADKDSDPDDSLSTFLDRRGKSFGCYSSTSVFINLEWDSYSREERIFEV